MRYGVRIAVIDSDEFTKEARLLLLQSQPEFSVVFDADSPSGALETIGDYLIDVVVLDAKVPGFRLDQYVRSLSQALEASGNPARILVLGNFISSNLIFECLAAGASVVHENDGGAASLLQSVRALAKGEITITRQRIESLLSSLPDRPAPKGVLALSLKKLDEHQRSVLTQLLAGKPDSQIAKDSNLSKYRVSKFLDTLTTSSGLRTRLQLAIDLVVLGFE